MCKYDDPFFSGYFEKVLLTLELAKRGRIPTVYFPYIGTRIPLAKLGENSYAPAKQAMTCRPHHGDFCSEYFPLLSGNIIIQKDAILQRYW